MPKWLSCSIGPGQFLIEYAVAGLNHSLDGGTQGFSLFAPKDLVIPLTADADGPGLVLVDVVEQEGDLVLVRLPAETFEGGRHVTARASGLREGGLGSEQHVAVGEALPRHAQA